MAPDPRAARRAELVLARRTTAATSATPSARRRNRSASLAAPAAIPAVVAVASLTAGAVLRNWLPLVAVIGCGVAAVVAVDVAATRRGLAARDRKELLAATAVAAVLAVGAATGISARLVLLAVGAVAVATARVAAHPATRDRKARMAAAAARAVFLAEKEAEWSDRAVSFGAPHVRLRGPVRDDGVGHTYQLMVPRGDTIAFLAGRLGNVATALGYPTGRVTFEEDPDGYGWLCELHVREQDPSKTADELTDVAVGSICDPLPLGPYADGVPYLLRLFVKDEGAIDTAFVGAKKYGKSSGVIRLFRLLRKARDVAWMIADGGDGKDFGLFSESVFRYSKDPSVVARWVTTLQHVSAGRGPKLEARRWRVWRPSAGEPIYVLVLEEAPSWASSPAGAEIKEGLETLMTKNRSTGIIVLVVSQMTTGKGIFGHVVRRMIQNRLQFRMNETSETVLEHGPRPEVFRGAGPGAFVGETEGEERGIRAQVVWTDDEERPEIAAEMAENNAFPEAEWEAAEQAQVRAGTTDESASRAVPAMAEDGVLEGEIVASRTRPTVRPGIVLPVVLPSTPKVPEMRDADAEHLFREAMRAAGPGGLSRSELDQLTGWRKTKTMGTLVHPAMRAGLVVKIGDGPGTRYVWASALPVG